LPKGSLGQLAAAALLALPMNRGLRATAQRHRVICQMQLLRKKTAEAEAGTEPTKVEADMEPQRASALGEEDQTASQQWQKKQELTNSPPKTTVMLRNLPVGYTRAALLELLQDEGFKGSFDFVYLPMDFASKVCLGYAFVNFISASDAERCWQVFDGFTGWGMGSEKTCTVTWGDPYQGLDAHVERYQNSPVMHHSVPDEWKPIILQAGQRIPFPAPTKNIGAPKMRRRSMNRAGRLTS